MSESELTADLRVLHVLGAMARGGIETWLMHVLRHPQPGIRHELCLTKPEEGPYEAECRALQIPIHRVEWRKNPLTWAAEFFALLRREGPFDVVHSHAHLFSGLVLSVAAAAKVPKRIAHVHTTVGNAQHGTFIRLLYAAGMRRLIRTMATDGIGISELATRDMFGSSWRRNPKLRLILYGFDFSRFAKAEVRGAQVRRDLGIPEDTPLFGNVARFVEFKNHRFLIEVFAEISRRRPEARFVLVGKGPLEGETRQRVAALALTDKVIFTGEQDDVAAYMSAMDLFLMPSWTEGLGIVVVEALASGTSVLMTETLPTELDLWPGAVFRLPLNAGAAAWGEAALVAAAQQRDRSQGLAHVLASPFDIARCVSELRQVYDAQRPVSRVASAS